MANPLLSPLVSKLPTVGSSIFTVMSELALRSNAVNLGQGCPDFNPPDQFRQALDRHVAEGRNQYAPMPGVLRLREQIAQQTERKYGVSVAPDEEVTITDGATEGVFDVIATVVRAGDEVVIFDPSYDSYAPNVRLHGGRPEHVPLRDDFSIDWQRLRDRLGPKTRLVIVNFPHNPSGAILSSGDLQELAEALSATNAYVLSDEVYEHIVFDGAQHRSLLTHPTLRQRTFVVSSFGKTYHTTGWKVGWVTAPPALTRELRKIHQFVTFSTATAAQYAFADLLESHPSLIAGLAGFYQRKRDLFGSLIAPVGFQVLPSPATYFQLADYSSLSDEDDLAFSRRMTTQVGVAVIPLSPFFSRPPERRLVRFCFAKNDSTLLEAAERLRAAYLPSIDRSNARR
jgi:methionine transaminase